MEPLHSAWQHERETASHVYREVIRKAIRRYRQHPTQQNSLIISAYWPLYRIALRAQLKAKHDCLKKEKTMPSKKRSTATHHDLALGRRLRKLRREKNLTQVEVGNMLGVTFQQIQKYEQGTNRLKASDLMHLCKTLNVPIETFFGPSESATMYVLQEEYRLVNWWRKAPSPLQDAILYLAQKAAGLKSG